MILGLDVSTSCTGWSLVDGDGRLIDQGFVLLQKLPSSYKKAAAVEELLRLIHAGNKIERIFIEENLQSFRRGFSSAKTLSTLARFNGIVSLLSYQVFSIEPDHVNVNSARRTLGIKLVKAKKCGISTKDQVLAWARSQVSAHSFDWPIKQLKSGPRKGQRIDDPGCYDIADAYVVARTGALLVQRGDA